MAVRFKVLGCSGSESKGVHPCSFLLGEEVLFDAGSAAALLDLKQQTRIRAIYLTHCHLDHIKDLAFLGENIFSLLTQPIEVFAPATVLESIKRHLFNEVIWPDFTVIPTKERPVFRFVPIEEGRVIPCVGLPGIDIEPVGVNHPGPTFGFIIRGSKRAIVYTGDTGPTAKIWERVRQRPEITDILLETTFPDRLAALALKSQHLTTSGLRAEIAKIQRTDVTIHVYHVKVPYLEEIRRELGEWRESRVRLLKPGDEFELA